MNGAAHTLILTGDEKGLKIEMASRRDTVMGHADNALGQLSSLTVNPAFPKELRAALDLSFVSIGKMKLAVEELMTDETKTYYNKKLKARVVLPAHEQELNSKLDAIITIIRQVAKDLKAAKLDATSFDKLVKFSSFADENGKLKGVKNGTDIRNKFYPDWDDNAQDIREKKLQARITDARTKDPTKTNHFWCPCCKAIVELDPKTPANGSLNNAPNAALDHKKSVGEHWSDTKGGGCDTTQAARNGWYNLPTNLENVICRPCNSSKNGENYTLYVTPNFRGPGEA